MDPITITDLTQVGRVNAPDPNQPRIFVTYNADFSAAANIILDFTVVNQQQTFGIVRSLGIDNGSNPNEVEVSVSGTDDYFTVPAYAQGVFKINATNNSRISFVTDGGATDKVTISLYNWEVAPAVWYRFGAFNVDRPIKIEGANPTGTDTDTSVNNYPVFIAGRQSDGTLTPVLVDALGRLDFATSITVGGVYGADPMGGAPVNPGLAVAVLNSSGNLVYLQLDADGDLVVSDNEAQTKLDTIIAELATLNTEVADIGADNERPSTATRSSVTAAVGNTTILGANANRLGATIYNDSVAIMYLALGSIAASTTNYTVQVAAGGYYEVPAKYTGTIRAIWASATGAARVTELA